MSTYTSGPWSLAGPYAQPGSEFHVLYVDGPTNGAVASVHMHHECGQANANLIAAAPDLLAALDDILDYRGGANNALEDEHVMDRARAAISRAREGI